MVVGTTIKVGRQAVELVTNDNRVIIELEDLKKKLTLFEKVQDPRTKRFHNVPKSAYYLYEEHDNFFKIIVSINSLRHIIDMIKRARVEHKVTIEKMNYKPSKSYLSLNGKFIPREEQEKFIQALTDDNGVPSFLLDLQPGYGKAEWVENKIRIPNGWKRMGDIIVGDEVIAKDGTITEVTGVYPQGKKLAYRVYFEDDRYITCCNEHLWGIYVNGKYQVLNTNDIKSKYIDKNKKVYIDLIESEQNEDKVYGLSPLEASGSRLQCLDLYLDSSTKQRQQYLNGLENNENIVRWQNADGTKNIVVHNESLAKQIRLLIHSLGGICNILTNGIKVSRNMLNKEYCIKYSFKESKLKIANIIPLNTALDMQCISISHPDKLYVTQDYVVTHNTLIGYHSMVRMKQKFCVLVKPTFLDKWVDDVRKYSDITEEQIYVIRGRESLLKLFDMKREEVRKIDVFVTSMRTITNYHYLCFTENFYKVRPENFMEYTGITNVLNDESHKEFEALFKVIMWMNPYKLLGLSATMDSNKPGENDFYNLLYPTKDRLNSMFGLNKYLTLMFVNYKLAKGINLPHKTFKGYNHIMYEQAIMKNINVLTDYIEMILDMVAKYYIDYQEEQKYEFKNPKCLLFFSTVDMCMIMTKKIKEVYKHLKVQKYTAEDKYEDMMQSDIIISTPASLSTGIDVPNLITAIQTVSIGDQQLNIQAAGRLREIKGKDVLYVCLQTDSIQKQQQLKLKRLNTLRDRVRYIRYDNYHKYIGIKGAKDVGFTGNKTVYKTPFFGKKTFYKSPFGKSGTKQKTWDRNQGRYKRAS